MRFSDFIQEASIFTKPGTYGYGHKVNIAVNNKNMGAKLFAAIQEFDSTFTGDEELEWIRPVTKDSTPDKQLHPIAVGRGEDKRYFKLPDGRVLVFIGTDKAIQGGLIHAKGEKGSTAENAGDASEPVLSAAIVAKLIKRGQNDVEDIDADDVKNVLAQAIKDPSLTFEVNDKNSRIADTIKFTIMVKKPTLNFLADPEFWNGKMGVILPSVVHYANSGHMDRYADFFYKNGKVDMIHVKSDGVSESKERKTDVEATANGKPLKSMNVSLKAGSPHIGQVGAGSLKDPFSDEYPDPKNPGKMKGRLGIWTASNKLFSPFGIVIPKPTGPVTSKVQYWREAYMTAAEQLKEMLSGESAKAEAGVVTKIANFVSGHGTSGDANIKLVSLGAKGISTVHSFKNLQRKLIADDINLDCKYREGKSKVKGDPRPELRVFDKNSGRDVMYIRYSSTEDETKIWNTVEMKELLKELTTLSYIKTVRDPMDNADEPKQIAGPKVAPVTKSAATPNVQQATSTSIPTTPVVKPVPTQPMYGKNVNTLSNGTLARAPDEEKVEMEDLEDKDLVRLRHLSGIVGHMSNHV
jgi:hypothetical protein